MIQLFARILGVLAVFAYPLVIYIGLTRWSTRTVAMVVLIAVTVTTLLKLRRVSAGARRDVLSAPAAVGVLMILAALTHSARFILAMPVLVSVVLLLTFARTLRGEVSMIERYARLMDPILSPAEVAHCRQVTQVWCGFFIVNAIIAATLALFAPTAWWALYTGLLSYGLMGALFAVEFIVRKARFRRYSSRWPDRVLARILPPPPACEAAAAADTYQDSNDHAPR